MADTPPRAPMRLWLRVLLFASLAVNLAIAGLIAGAVASGRVGDRPRMDLNLGPFMRAIGEEDRRAIIADVRGRPDLRPPSLRERRRDLVEMVEILRAPDFDAEAMSAILARQREAASRIVTAAHEAFITRLTEATPEARAAFADRLADEMRRSGPDERGGHDDRGHRGDD